MPYGTEVRGPIRVLYMDPDPHLGARVGEALRHRGHVLEHVTDSAAGIARLAVGDIDVIALDHRLPGETGIDVLRRLGPRAARPPVVYVTAEVDARTAVQAIKAGADDYVIKDGSGEFFELMISGVEHVFERWRLKRLREENEQAVREARDRAEMLLREVSHRVANSLALVASMVRMQAMAVADPAAQQALHEAQNRIMAMASVHHRLYASEHVGLVQIDDYLGQLVADLQNSLADDERPYTVKLEAEPVTLSIDKAVSLGVILGELLTNAFKYAYPKGEAAEIRVSLTRLGAGLARLSVEDDGSGFDPRGPSQGTGLGTRITDAMAMTLKATIQRPTRAKGTSISIDFPAD